MSKKVILKPRSQKYGFFHPISLIATWFGAGLVRFAPGTIGSLAALPFAWLIVLWGGQLLLLAASITLFIFGIWIAEKYSNTVSDEDPQSVVIDEVAGQWLTLTIIPLDPWLYLVSFALFRTFDIAKPWPISQIDSQLKGGLGIMLDDIIAAGYAIFTLLIMKVIF